VPISARGPLGSSRAIRSRDWLLPEANRRSPSPFLLEVAGKEPDSANVLLLPASSQSGKGVRMSEERRKHSRLKVRVPVELRSEASEAPTRAETADLSLGGCYIEMLFTLEIGTELDVTLRLGDSTLLAVGRVVTCDRTVGNGIQFMRMLPEDREELDRFLQTAEEKQKADTRSAEG
jgi:c-di-GMP-binding flagellar brake protein YcgR